jgi:hypothetical protein
LAKKYLFFVLSNNMAAFFYYESYKGLVVK